VRAGSLIAGPQIGYDDPASDPEVHPDQTGDLDGVIDEVSGHGTFIAGLVHQAAPDADIVAWRVVDSDGTIVESDLVAALAGIANLGELAARSKGGLALDVLNLSMGYYHETPQDALFDPTMYEILAALGRNGTVVVVSAGNDSTARPSFPASVAPWSNGYAPIALDPHAVPIVSVGALNPNGTTVALFSNTGFWVRTYELGAAVVSTIPTGFQGGWQPAARTDAWGHTRESIDADDFSGGFAVWSGTSFAAPVVAGRIAAVLDAVATHEAKTADRRGAIDRAWTALEKVTPIRR
jgi:subtilisin family serine protease